MLLSVFFNKGTYFFLKKRNPPHAIVETPATNMLRNTTLLLHG